MTLKALHPVQYLEFNSRRLWKVKSTFIFLKNVRMYIFFFACLRVTVRYSFLLLMPVAPKAVLSLLVRFQTNSMQYQAEEKLREEPKFGTSGRYHFELRSLTSCLTVKFITFTFKKAPRYTSVSFVLFRFVFRGNSLLCSASQNRMLLCHRPLGELPCYKRQSVGRNVEKEFILYWCFLIPCDVLYILILPLLVYSIKRRYKISQYNEKERKIFPEISYRI